MCTHLDSCQLYSSYTGSFSCAFTVIIVSLQGEHALRTEDIVAKIMKEGDSIALVLFSGKRLEA